MVSQEFPLMEAHGNQSGWRIPIAIIGGVILQTFAIGWWASAMQSRVDNLDRRMTIVEVHDNQRGTDAVANADRLARLEEQLKTGLGTLNEIKALLANQMMGLSHAK